MFKTDGERKGDFMALYIFEGMNNLLISIAGQYAVGF
jgi:hypothetical protein